MQYVLFHFVVKNTAYTVIIVIYSLMQWFLIYGTCTPRGYESLNLGV